MIGLALVLLATADNAAAPADEPALEAPTLRSLGVVWTIRGDDNRNARVDVAWRRSGDPAWRPGPPLFRVESGAATPPIPAGSWRFAGSVVLLDPETDYELRLSLCDPDGAPAERVLKARTIGEPRLPAGLKEVHVRPGPDALTRAQRDQGPGTVFLLHAGTYEPFTAVKDGEEGRPVVWRSAGDGEVVIDGRGEGTAITAGGRSHVWFEGLTIRNAHKAFQVAGAKGLVVRRCRISRVDYGVQATAGDVERFFIADNVIEGPSTWPRSKGIEGARGIQVTGTGHVICHNRIRGFADAIDTMPSDRCAAIDIHNNDLSVLTDDGIETDYSERNVRVFHNRLTDVYQGISAQPTHGGPIYVFRNVLYNVVAAPFKLHERPSGVLLYHNTVVKAGAPNEVKSPKGVYHCVSRNNLFVGGESHYAFGCEAQMVGCDFDYDGFAGGPWALALKWNDVRYETWDQVRRKAPVYRNAAVVDAPEIRRPEDPAREHPVPGELRAKGAVDRGQVLPGFNDGFSGSAPDLGAFEEGVSLPHYGPRVLSK